MQLTSQIRLPSMLGNEGQNPYGSPLSDHAFSSENRTFTYVYIKLLTCSNSGRPLLHVFIIICQVHACKYHILTFFQPAAFRC